MGYEYNLDKNKICVKTADGSIKLYDNTKENEKMILEKMKKQVLNLDDLMEDEGKYKKHYRELEYKSTRIFQV